MPDHLRRLASNQWLFVIDNRLTKPKGLVIKYTYLDDRFIVGYYIDTEFIQARILWKLLQTQRFSSKRNLDTFEAEPWRRSEKNDVLLHIKRFQSYAEKS